MVGLLLPPSVPGALVNFAALLMGKVPVNLNYTVSEETLLPASASAASDRSYLPGSWTGEAKVPGQALLEELAANPAPASGLCALSACSAGWLVERSWDEKRAA
jgi:acyl-[acyl-carrier-protein]-phospholipid O-acyltransferase/long-chain-fatty-acid--[acyl-carrier-protein] ligase